MIVNCFLATSTKLHQLPGSQNFVQSLSQISNTNRRNFFPTFFISKQMKQTTTQTIIVKSLSGHSIHFTIIPLTTISQLKRSLSQHLIIPEEALQLVDSNHQKLNDNTIINPLLTPILYLRTNSQILISYRMEGKESLGKGAFFDHYTLQRHTSHSTAILHSLHPEISVSHLERYTKSAQTFNFPISFPRN